jgi:hypothetical protein
LTDWKDAIECTTTVVSLPVLQFEVVGVARWELPKDKKTREQAAWRCEVTKVGGIRMEWNGNVRTSAISKFKAQKSEAKRTKLFLDVSHFSEHFEFSVPIFRTL